MDDFPTLRNEIAELQSRAWPPVRDFQDLGAPLADFLELTTEAQRARLMAMAPDRDRLGRFLNEALADIYTYVLGYRDGPCHLTLRDDLELELCRAKIVLERGLIEWLAVPPARLETDQRGAVQHLIAIINNNPGVYHALFDYLRDAAPRETIVAFLKNEVLRNELVDDEIALLVPGFQGMMKKVLAANLWDECGRGSLKDFHVYWLRRLVEKLDAWAEIRRYRETDRPWFALIVSNVFDMLLTRPGFRFMAYGAFVILESWVEPHHRRLLEGMERVGLHDEDLQAYFREHVDIDPDHTRELLRGIATQTPALGAKEIDDIVTGAQVFVRAAREQYDRMIVHLKSIETSVELTPA